ncbi:unnamed protein product [Amoebophrya sp. A120]|nr:unnamed protein product [Amoebophrya sp. A120]|eukprot:GSA120T00016592001.1
MTASSLLKTEWDARLEVVTSLRHERQKQKQQELQSHHEQLRAKDAEICELLHLQQQHLQKIRDLEKQLHLAEKKLGSASGGAGNSTTTSRKNYHSTASSSCSSSTFQPHGRSHGGTQGAGTAGGGVTRATSSTNAVGAAASSNPPQLLPGGPGHGQYQNSNLHPSSYVHNSQGVQSHSSSSSSSHYYSNAYHAPDEAGAGFGGGAGRHTKAANLQSARGEHFYAYVNGGGGSGQQHAAENTRGGQGLHAQVQHGGATASNHAHSSSMRHLLQSERLEAQKMHSQKVDLESKLQSQNQHNLQLKENLQNLKKQLETERKEKLRYFAEVKKLQHQNDAHRIPHACNLAAQAQQNPRSGSAAMYTGTAPGGGGSSSSTANGPASMSHRSGAQSAAAPGARERSNSGDRGRQTKGSSAPNGAPPAPVQQANHDRRDRSHSGEKKMSARGADRSHSGNRPQRLANAFGNYCLADHDRLSGGSSLHRPGSARRSHTDERRGGPAAPKMTASAQSESSSRLHSGGRASPKTYTDTAGAGGLEDAMAASSTRFGSSHRVAMETKLRRPQSPRGRSPRFAAPQRFHPGGASQDAAAPQKNHMAAYYASQNAAR